MTASKEQLVIKPSDSYFKFTLIGGLLTVIVLCFLVTLLLLVAFPPESKLQPIMIVCLWIFLPILWAIGSIMLYLQKRETSYTLTQKSLIVLNGSPFGGNKETMYRYDSILSVESRQGPLGKKFNYGTIYITVPKLENRVVLRGIADPHDLARNVKEYVNDLSGNSKALIS